MRNLKKLFAVIMTVAMLASVMIPALAAESFSYEAEAQKLYDLGLFKGNSTTSYVPDLGTSLNRQAGLALTIRLLGKDAEVAAMTEEEVAEQLAKIVDADEINDWAKPYAAYAVKNGLTDGIDATILPNVKFGAQLDLSGKEFINFVLKAMGYRVGWDDVLTKAAEVGMLSASEAVTFGTTAVLNRDMAVGVMAKSLAGTTAAGVTLAQALVDAGAVTSEAMAAAGFFAPTATPTPAPVDLAIAETLGENRKVVVVSFNKAFDKDTINTDNVKVTDGPSVEAVKYSDDNTTVYVVLANTGATQNQKVKVKFSNVKDLDGNKMADTEVEVYMKDLTVPEILGATVIDAKTIEISATEPINYVKSSNTVLNDIKIDGLSPVAKTEFDYVRNVLTINLSTKLSVGTHTLTIKGMKDYNDLIAVDKEFTIAVSEDTTAPAIESATIKDKKTIEIVFTEKLSKVGTFTIDNKTFTVEHDGNKKVTLKNIDPALDIGAILEVKIKYKDQEDVVGNKVSPEQTFVTNTSDDTTLPEVTVEVGDGGKLVFTFTKKMENVGKITIKKASDDSEIVSTEAWSFKNDENKVIELTAAEAGIANQDAADYKAVLENFKDASIRGNALPTTTLEFKGKDTNPPSVALTYTVDKNDSDRKKDTITFYFSESMDEDTLKNLSNYVRVSDNEPFSRIADVSIKEIKDNSKTVVIYYPNAGDITDANVNDTTAQFRVTALKDLAGNWISTTTVKVILSSAKAILVTNVKATATDKIEVYFNTEIKSADPSAFMVKKIGTDDVIGMINYEIKNNSADSEYKVVFTLGSAMSSDTSLYELYENNANMIQNVYGSKLDVAGDGLVFGGNIVDAIRPTISKVEAATGYIVNVTVSEVVYCANDLDVLFNAMIIKDKDGNVLDASNVGADKTITSIVFKNGDADSTLNGGFDKIVINFNSNHKGKNVVFTFIAKNIKDAADNLITEKAAESVTIK